MFNLHRTFEFRRIVSSDVFSFLLKNKRISKLASSTRNYLTTLLTHGNWIGLVEFNQVGKIISPLREVSNANVTYYLASLVPVDTARGTCIGCGLQKAFEVCFMFLKRLLEVVFKFYDISLHLLNITNMLISNGQDSEHMTHKLSHIARASNVVKSLVANI